MNVSTLQKLQERAREGIPFRSLLAAYLNLPGTTRQSLADELGVDRSTISRWISGQKPTQVHEKALLGVILGTSTGHQSSSFRSQQTTHVLFCLDSSGSMNAYKDVVIEAFNASLAQVKETATVEGQIATASLWTFGERGNLVDQKFFNESLNWLRPLTPATYYPSGMTPLFDCVGTAIDEALKIPGAEDPSTSFLLMVQTDGEENASSKYRYTLVDLMKRVQATDRWTIAFMVPPGKGAALASKFGVPPGNVREWESSSRGAREVGIATTQGISSYFRSRALGAKAAKNFYTTDLSKVRPSDVRKLTDVRNEVTALKVPREVAIKEFVEAELGSYRVGSAFYQLTKEEEVQRNKEILVKEKDRGAVYWGPDARNLLGLPPGDVKVKPGNHANYDVFVQSTSTNRKLVRGTTLLVMK